MARAREASTPVQRRWYVPGTFPHVPRYVPVRSKRPHTFWHANCWTDSSSRHVLTSSVQPFRAIWKASYKSLQYFNVYVTFWHVPPSIRCCPSIILLRSDTFQLSSDTFYHAKHQIYMFLDTFWYVLCSSIAKTSKKIVLTVPFLIQYRGVSGTRPYILYPN